MADLKESAEKFIEDLVAQNMGGLMAALTSEGMGKAMALGQGAQPTGTPTRKEAILLDAEGDNYPVDLILATETQEFVIGTTWKQVGDDWKVNDIQIKKQP